MLEIPKLSYMNFDGWFKEKLCVYSPEFYNSKKGYAGWYKYDLNEFLNGGLKKILRLGRDNYFTEEKLIGNNNLSETQCVKIEGVEGIANSDLFDLVAFVHYKMLEKKEYEFLEDYGEFRFI